MAWIFEDDFESYTVDAALNGQGGWSGDTTFYVRDATPAAYEGSQYAEIDGVSNDVMENDITAETDGIVYVSLLNSKGTADVCDYRIHATATIQIYLQMLEASNNIRIYDGDTAGWWDLQSGYTASQWYRIGIELDYTTDDYRANIDGGTFSAWKGMWNVGTQANRLRFNSQALAGKYAFDYISPNATAGGAVIVSPAAQVATFSIPTYTVGTGITFSPSALVAIFSVPTYSVKTGVTASPAAQVATFSVPTYTVLAGAVTIFPAAQVATLSIPSYAVNTGLSITPSTQVATFTIPTYTVTAKISVIVSVAVQVLTFSLPTLAKVGGVWSKVARATDSTWSRISRNSQ